MAKTGGVLLGKGALQLDLGSVKCSALSPDNRKLAILKHDGKLSIVDTSITCTTYDAPGTFQSVCWISNNDREESGLFALESTGHISLYSLSAHASENGFECTTQCHRNTLQSLLSEWIKDTDISIADESLYPSFPGSALLKYGHSLVVLEVKPGRTPEVRSVIDDGHVLYSKDNLLLSLGGDGYTVHIWDTVNGVNVGNLNLSQYTSGRITQGSFYDDLSCAAFVNEENLLFVINLNEYFSRIPSALVDETDSYSEENDNAAHTLDEDIIPGEHGVEQRRIRVDPFWKNKLANIRAGRPSVQPSWSKPWFVSRPSTTVANIQEKRSLVERRRKRLSGFAVKRTDDEVDSLPNKQILVYERKLCDNDVCVKKMYTTGNILVVLTEGIGETTLLAINYLKKDDIKVVIPGVCVLVPSTSPTFPTLALTSTGVEIIALNLEKEKLVNSVMLYESAGVADTLCRLNGWDRCTIPIHALEVGLRHRQLDTVAFFLKSRENIFISHDNNPLLSKPPGPSEDLPLPKAGDLDLGQIEPAIELLITTVEQNISDKQSRQFAEQLLHVTLNYLHKVTYHVNDQLTKVKEAGKSSGRFELEVGEALLKIMDHIGKLRTCMGVTFQPKTRVQDRVSHLPKLQEERILESIQENMTAAQRKLMKNWKKMTQAEAITDGILSGEIPILQLFLRQQSKGKEAGLSDVIEFGLKKAFEFLQERQLLHAAQIFANLGFDVWTKLRQICLYTPDKSLRDYLVSELQTDGHLSQDELDMVGFVRRLEGLYSCPSFQLAKELKTEDTSSDWEKECDLSDVLEGKNMSAGILESVGEIAPTDVGNSETASYGHFVLEWFREWDEETKQRVQIDQLIKRRGMSHAEGISALVVWRYLISHRDTHRILNWINSAFSDGSESKSGSHDWPYCLPIHPSFLSELHDADSVWANTILDELAKKGLFCSDKMDMAAIERRLSRITGLFQEPHLLEQRPEQHGLVLYDLHKHIITKCINNKLPDLLYFYLDYWNLCKGDNDLLEVGISREEIEPWVSMVLHMRAIADDPNDPMRVFNASLSASAFIQERGTEDVCVSSMLEDGLVGRALATLVYNPEELKNMLNDCASDQSPSISKWESALSLFPRLRTALCTKPSNGAAPADVNVYHLLQGNVPFDVTQLFGWQRNNNLFTGDMFSMMPHFGSEELSAQFGRKLSLTYKYYLRQGRPSFAFCSYIICILQAGLKSIPSRRFKIVVHQTHCLALRKFNQSHVAAACVAFLEMLGHDTTHIRIDLHAASLVFAHQAGEITGNVEQRRQAEEHLEKNIASLIIGCLKKRRKQATEVLMLLEEAVRWHIERHSLKSSSPEVLGLWQLVLMFCHTYVLPLSTAYLRDCALADDWLMFLTFAQIHRLDKKQVHAEVTYFSKPPLREHLHYVVENVDVISPHQTTPQQSEAPIPARDIRAQLYSRIGLTRAKDKGGESSLSEASFSEDESEATEKEDAPSTTEDLALPSEDNFDDVFSLLLACDEMKSPWTCLNAFSIRYRNPVLAVLAACYQEHNDLSCLCCWLFASADGKTHQALITSFSDCELQQWKPQDIQTIILIMAKELLFKTMLDGFLIFYPECLIVPFLQFCVSFHRYEDQDVCRQHLDLFKRLHASFIRKAQSGNRERGTPDDEPILGVQWVEKAVTGMLCQFLQFKGSRYDMGRLLQLLDLTNCTRLFSCEGMPDFSKLYRLHQMMSSTDLSFNYNDFKEASDPRYKAACDRALRALEAKKMYKEARVFAEVASIPGEMITIRQVKAEMDELKESSVWQQRDVRCNFWRKCGETFTRYQVSHANASAFFQREMPSSQDHKEHGLLCQLAYDSLHVGDDPSNDTLKKDLFVKMWMSRIRHIMESDQDDNEKDIFSWMFDTVTDKTASMQRTELLQYGHIPSENDSPYVHLDENEEKALEKLIGKLLDSGKVKDACQVAVIIGKYSQNLTLVITCLRLALGHITPPDINMAIRNLISEPTRRISRRLSTPAYSLLPLGSFVSLSTPETNEELESSTVSTIRLLLDHVTCGQTCAKRILVTCQISQVLNKSFEWIVGQDEFILLQALLNSNHSLRFHLTKDFLSFSRLAPAQVVGFLTDVILKILNTNYCDGDVKLDEAIDSTWVSVKGSASLVLNILQLCDEPALLGQTLHDNMSAMLASNHELSTTPLSVCVELLIASHQCHTMACSMEGIATVLRSARQLTDILSNAEQYNLLIRLLMGVGRFSEMTYIFDILKQHHHLERLFSKGVDKNESLRMAILDYVQRCHPSDTDTYKMVSLYFTMYREIATMLESNADRLLKGMKGKPLDSGGEYQATLQSVVHYYSDAAESYVKENCLRQAQTCVKNARLVALQLQLLNSGQRVVNLSKDEQATFIISHPKFWEAYIIADAYGNHTHWASAICKRTVIQGDQKYLADLLGHITVTPTLIGDVVERYKQESHKPKSATTHVKKLLGMCNDVQTRYRLALSLGYTEYARELLKGENGAYLRDVLGTPY